MVDGSPQLSLHSCCELTPCKPVLFSSSFLFATAQVAYTTALVSLLSIFANTDVTTSASIKQFLQENL